MRSTLTSNGAVTTQSLSHSASAAVPMMTAPSSTKSFAPACCAACLAARMRRTISGWVSASSSFPLGRCKGAVGQQAAVKGAVFLYNICPEALSQLGQQR